MKDKRFFEYATRKLEDGIIYHQVKVNEKCFYAKDCPKFHGKCIKEFRLAIKVLKNYKGGKYADKKS